MIRIDFTADDVIKLRRAYDDLENIIRLTEEFNKRYGEKKVTNGFIRDAHKCLSEVLYGC